MLQEQVRRESNRFTKIIESTLSSWVREWLDQPPWFVGFDVRVQAGVSNKSQIQGIQIHFQKVSDSDYLIEGYVDQFDTD